MSRLAFLSAKIAVTVALLWFALRHVDAAAIGAAVAGAQGWTLAAAVLTLAAQPLIGALRWHVIMGSLGARATPRQSVRLTYVSTFLNQVLPGGFGGDAMRLWLSVREGHLLKNALNAVALDRMLGLLALIAVATFCAFQLDAVPRLGPLAPTLALLAVLAVAGTGIIMLLDRLPLGLRRFRAARAAAYIAQDARRLLLSPRLAPLVGALALLGIANLCASLYLFLRAFNVPLEPGLLALAVPPVILASSAPVSVGGWGTREAALVVMLGALAAPAGPGVVASVAFGVAGILISLPGAFWLSRPAPGPGAAAL